MAKQDKIVWDESANVTENVRAKLPELLSEYFEAGRELVNAKITPQLLHRFRLRTKRLRYTLELFRQCYGPGLDLRLAELRQLQQLLGEINDYAATEALLAHVPANQASDRPAFQGFLQAETGQRITRFCKHWKENFDREGRELWWTRYLSRSIVRKAK